MKFSRPDNEEISLNLAPLIDVVFLLLIFFMVTTSFTQDQAIDLVLPEASSDLSKIEGEKLVISVTKRNDISIASDQEKITIDADDGSTTALMKSIAQAISQFKNNHELQTNQPTIVIEADRTASHGRVIELMDALSKLGVNKIQFAVDSKTVQ